MPLSRRYIRTPADFHPEFGYLSPSGRRRSTVRVALAAATFGLVTGVVGAIVLLPRTGRDLRIVHAFAAVQSEPSILGLAVTAPAAEQTPGIDGSAGQSLPAAAGGRSKQPAAKGSSPAPTNSEKRNPAPAAKGTTRPTPVDAEKRSPAPAAADADKPCKEETWPYFDSKCLWGGPRKDATVATAPAVATPPAASQRPSPPAATQRPSPPAETQRPSPPAETQRSAPPATVAVAPDVAADATTAPEPRPPVVKKKPKSTNTAARRRREEFDPRTAYVNPNGSPYGGPFGNAYGNGQWRGGWGGWGW
jgi:hypothetical protein